MIGCGPPAVYVFAQSSASSNAARATPTAAMPATGPDQAKLRLINRSPFPRVPSIRLAAGTRALSKTISQLGARRCPDVLMDLYVTPGVPRSTITADNPRVPPASGSVRTTTRLTLAPWLSQPPTLHGQYLRPLRTYCSPSSVAVTDMPAPLMAGASKFAVPPGDPGGSLAAYPTMYSPLVSAVAVEINRSFCSSVP